MRFMILVDHRSESPEDASRCPSCDRAMPVFNQVHAVLGPDAAGVVVRTLDFAITCPCSANLTIRLVPGFRLPSESEPSERDTRDDN